MQLIFNLQDDTFSHGSVITVGNFDGLHKGHQAIIKKTTLMARELNLPSVVVLFEPQPQEYFQQSNSCVVRLSSLRDKVCDIKNYGVDYIYCLKFNKKLALMEPLEFIQNYIFNKLNSKYIIVGKDFRFGKDRGGNINLLIENANNNNTIVEVFDDFVENNERISSTKIRQDLLKDNLSGAWESLGHPYWLYGKVISGDKRGRKWGIPTANLKLSHKNLPLKGVFCVSVTIENNDSEFFGVANIGVRPTVDGLVNLLEVHLLDFHDSLYEKVLRVAFLHKLRGEIKFPNVDDLIAQINQDISDTRNFFRACND